MDLIKYNSLCNEIKENEDLDESDRLIFYELHHAIAKPNKEILYRLINRQLLFKEGDYFYQLSEEERIQILILLEIKREENGLNRKEYEYLAYVNWKYAKKNLSSFPQIPNIIDITHSQFMEQFVYNDQRSELYSYLIKSLLKIFSYYKLENLNLIVGGSYCDISNQHPNDIDLILLLPKEIFQNDWQHTISNKIILEFKINGIKKIDLLKLPEDYNLEYFMSFELLTLLGNKPLVKKTELIVSNDYLLRHVYKLKYSS